MARLKRIKIAALNVTMPAPHTPDRYVELFTKAMSNQSIVRLRGTKAAIMTVLRHAESAEPAKGIRALSGELATFDHIEIDSSWLNIRQKKPATKEELEQIKLPPDIQPNARYFEFMFYPHGHVLYFVTGHAQTSLPPNTCADFLRNVFSRESLVKEFGKIRIDVIPDHETLSQILNLKTIDHLKFDLSRPNPDDLTGARTRVKQRLEAKGAQRVKQEIYAAPGESITPDKSLTDEMLVAADNGNVEAIGRTSAGKKIHLKTATHPLIAETKYDPDLQLSTEAFFDKADGLYQARLKQQKKE